MTWYLKMVTVSIGAFTQCFWRALDNSVFHTAVFAI